MLPLCPLTGLAPVMSSSSRTGMCGALLWLGWTCGSGEPAPYTPNPGPWDLLKFPCTHPTLTPQRAGENGSSGQAATKATTTAPIQPLFLRRIHLTGCQVNEQRQLLHVSTIRLTRGPHKGWFLWSTILTALNVPLWERKSQPLSILSPFTVMGEITSL